MGAEKYPDLEQFNIMHVHFLCVLNYAVLEDCSRYPMYIESYKRGIKYWLKIIQLPETMYVKTVTI